MQYNPAVRSNKLDVPQGDFQKIGVDRENNDTQYAAAHSIHFKTYYFIYDRSLIPSSLYTYVKNLGTEVGGIKLYRNGFRVPPYGEKNNDWLGLDSSVRRKTLLFPHQNQSFFGYVEIDDSAAELFEETSSREGLIENQAFDDIKDYVYRVIITACQEVAALRNRKQTANQKDWEKKSPNQKMQEALIKLGYLKASATGYCGQSTVDAIKAFQTANQLDADGKAGQTTLQLLYSGNAVSANAAAAPAATEEPAASPNP